MKIKYLNINPPIATLDKRHRWNGNLVQRFQTEKDSNKIRMCKREKKVFFWYKKQLKWTLHIVLPVTEIWLYCNITGFWFLLWYALVRVICWNMYVIWSFYPYIQQCLCNRCAIVEWVADGLWKTMLPKNICILHLFCHIINNPLTIFFFHL